MLILCNPKYWVFPLDTTEKRNWHIRALRLPYRLNRLRLETNDERRIYAYNVPQRALRQRWNAVYNINTERCYIYQNGNWCETDSTALPQLYRSIAPYYQTTTLGWYMLASGLWVKHKNLRGFYTWHADAPSDLVGMFHHEGGFTPLYAEYLAVRVDLPRDFAYGLIVYSLNDGTVVTPRYAELVWNLTDTL